MKVKDNALSDCFARPQKFRLTTWSFLLFKNLHDNIDDKGEKISLINRLNVFK